MYGQCPAADALVVNEAGLDRAQGAGREVCTDSTGSGHATPAPRLPARQHAAAAGEAAGSHSWCCSAAPPAKFPSHPSRWSLLIETQSCPCQSPSCRPGKAASMGVQRTLLHQASSGFLPPLCRVRICCLVHSPWPSISASAGRWPCTYCTASIRWHTMSLDCTVGM